MWTCLVDGLRPKRCGDIYWFTWFEHDAVWATCSDLDQRSPDRRSCQSQWRPSVAFLTVLTVLTLKTSYSLQKYSFPQFSLISSHSETCNWIRRFGPDSRTIFKNILERCSCWGSHFPQFSLICSHSETLRFGRMIEGPSSGWISKNSQTAFQIVGKGTLTETLYIFEFKPKKELDSREGHMSWSIS